MLPFSIFYIFYRTERHTYYVAFKNEETGRYLPAISTKKTKEADAVLLTDFLEEFWERKCVNT
jgi:hypothetical protein